MMRATATATGPHAVTLTVDGATYTDVPVDTWVEGAGPGWRAFLAASIAWSEMPVDAPARALELLEWPELETLEGLIADAIDAYRRDEHDNRYL